MCGELLIFDTNQQFATHRSIYGSDQIFSSDKLVDWRSHQSTFLPR